MHLCIPKKAMRLEQVSSGMGRKKRGRGMMRGRGGEERVTSNERFMEMIYTCVYTVI